MSGAALPQHENLMRGHGGCKVDGYVRLSVIAPCYNEEENVGLLVSRLLAVFSRRSIRGEIVLVNDASVDATGPMIEELSARHPEVVAVHHALNRGLAAAWNSGLAAARGTFVCFIDADLQNPPEEVWRLFREITQTHADMVQGVRSAIGRLRDGRYVSSRALNVLLNLAFGMSAADNKSGFVIARRETMIDILYRRFSYRHSHVFIGAAAHWRGYSIREVETLFQDRNAGQSFIKRWPFRLIAEVCVDTAKAFVELRLSRGRADVFEELLRKAPPGRRGQAPAGARRLGIEACLMTGALLQRPLLTLGVRRVYRALARTQWWTAGQLEELQAKRLGRLIRHAFHHVPYYREAFESAGLEPEAVASVADLRRLPLLAPAQARENVHFDLFADNHVKRQMLRIAVDTRNGGGRFALYVDRGQLEMRLAGTLRALDWAREGGPRTPFLPPHKAGTLRQKVGQALERRLVRWLLAGGAKPMEEPIGPFWALGFACAAREGLHVSAESYIVEVIREGASVPPGEAGELVVTDLDGLSLPLIRYRTGCQGILVARSGCVCGRELPRVQILGATPSTISRLAPVATTEAR